jgi:hypothetical protein
MKAPETRPPGARLPGMKDRTPEKTPPAGKPRPAKGKPPRDLAREDADSPNAIPPLPPRGDGS